MCLISLRFIKEVEDRIGDSLVEEITGEVIDLSVEIVMKVIEDMDVVEVILGEVIFEEEVAFEVDIIIVEWTEIGKIGEHGDNPGQEKEIEIDEVSHHLVLDRDQGLVQIDRIRCFKCKEYDHFANECPNLVPDSSDRESDSARLVSLHLADSDTGSDTEQYLNI